MSTTTSRTSRLAAVLGWLALVAFVLGPLAAHFEAASPLTGFAVFGLSLLLSLIAVPLGLAALLRGSGASRSRALVGFMPALVVLVVALAQALPSRDLPRINDITTDTLDAPQFVAAPNLPANRGRDMSYPGEEFARQQRDAYPDLAPLELSLPPTEAFARVRAVAAGMPGWTLTRTDPDAHAIEGVEMSWLFRFRDDFVVEVRARDGGSVVQMRSKSRDGKGDLGVNAKRIRDFFARLAG